MGHSIKKIVYFNVSNCGKFQQKCSSNKEYKNYVHLKVPYSKTRKIPLAKPPLWSFIQIKLMNNPKTHLYSEHKSKSLETYELNIYNMI